MSNQNNQANQASAPNILFYSNTCKTCNMFMTMCQNNKLLKYFQLVCVDDKVKELANKGLKIVPTIIIKGFSKPIEGKNVFNWLETTMSMRTNKQIDNSNEVYLPETGINTNTNINSAIMNRMQQNANIMQTSQPNLIPSVPQTNVIKRNVVQAPPIITPNSNTNPNPVANANPNLKLRNPNIIINESNPNNQSNQLNQPNQPNQPNQTNTPSVKHPYGFLQDEMSGFSDTFAYLLTDNPLPKSFLPPDKDLQIYTAPEGDKLDKRKQDTLIKSIETIRESDKGEFLKNIDYQHRQALMSQQK